MSATTTSRKKPLISDELEQMLALVKGSDSVELKLTVPESDQQSTVNALALDYFSKEAKASASNGA